MCCSLAANAQDYSRGDVNHNGNVSISDVTCLIDYLLNGTWPDDHEWVDLGLPSGTLWATCNVGADRPGDFGDYFAWGETTPKQSYSWENYKWCYGYSSTLIKYCTNSSFGYNGFVDNKNELDPEDDAAYANWGPSWRMPTYDQAARLYEVLAWSFILKSVLRTANICDVFLSDTNIIITFSPQNIVKIQQKSQIIMRFLRPVKVTGDFRPEA